MNKLGKDWSTPAARLAPSNAAQAPLPGALAVGVIPVRTTLMSLATGVLVTYLFATQPVSAQIVAKFGYAHHVNRARADVDHDGLCSAWCSCCR